MLKLSSVSGKDNLWFNEDMVDISGVLDRELGGREAAERRNVDLNFPVDVPRPAPDAWKEDRPDLVRMEGREVGEFGGVDNYVAYMGGEYEPQAVLTDEEKDEAVRRWESKFPDRENPYDLNSLTTGTIEYELMLEELRRGVLKGVGEPVEGYEDRPVMLSEVEVVIETGVDIAMIRNRRIREALKRLGGEDFVRDVWTDASEMTLVAPANEKAEWVMQLVGKPGDNGRRKLLAMTLSDWERMLVVREDSGLEREVRLPSPGDGSHEKVLPLVRSLFKLNFRGRSLPHDLKLSREFLH